MERKWRVLAVVCVAVFMLLLDITVVNVALPKIEKELRTSFTELQWVVDAYALTLAATMLNAGSLGDLLGRKRIFLVAIALFTIASALCGAATSPVWLIVARGAQGIGGAGMFAVSLAIISQEFHGRERGTAFGIWGATVGMAVAIGPLVGGALTTYVGWRWIFFVNIPIGFAYVAAGIRELHESRDEAHGGFDLPGLTTLTAGLFAVVLGLLRGNDWGWSSGREIGLFAGGSALLVAFAAIELRREEPMFDFRLFRVPTFTGAQITALALSAGMFSQFLYLALYLQDVLGYSPMGAGIRFLPLSLVSFVVAPIAGRLSARMPVRLLLSAGLALVGVSLLLMWGISLHSTWLTLLAGFVVGGIGIGLVNAPLASTAVSVVEPRRAGMASGINNTFRQVGIATGIAALGAIFQSKIASSLVIPFETPVKGVYAPLRHQWAQGIASGNLQFPQRGAGHVNMAALTTFARMAFIHGLNGILFTAAFVLFAGAILAFALVRRRDFVASGPAVEAAAG
ncbi:MAG TPA: MFS transporter [Gaiellaceae bacterium]|nr:MFS transporter [Gaiellaceae bacterium]